MKWITENSLYNFPFWSGGKENADMLTIEDLKRIENNLLDIYEDIPTETQLNNLFRFEFDTICQWLGYKDEDDFLNKRG